MPDIPEGTRSVPAIETSISRPQRRPRAELAPARSRPAGDGGLAERGAGGPETVNVLIVDDRPANLLTLSTILEQADLNLVRAASGREALRCLLQQDFAAILLDVNMPDLDGFQTAALIRQRPSSARTPIIFITAYGDEDQLYKAYALGAVDYILTPVHPDVLRAKVAVFVDLFRKTLEIQRQSEALRELEAHEHRRQLSETNERLDLALEAGRMGAWEWDLGEQLMTWSPTLEKIFGLLPGQFSGHVDELRSRLHPDDRVRVLEEMMAAARHGRPFCIEHRIIRGNGRIAWVEVRGRVCGTGPSAAGSQFTVAGVSPARTGLISPAPLSQPVGSPDGARSQAGRDGNNHDPQPAHAVRLAGVCMDITERKRAQDELAAHRDRLEELVAERTEELRASHERLRRSERLASLGTLAAGIAHEINNPLNAILLLTQYAMETQDEWSEDEIRRTLDSVIGESRRCAAIVKNVLRFAREEKAPKELYPLNDIMHRAVSLAKTYIEAPHLVLLAEADARIPLLMLNPTQVEQVLVNLIQNAAEAAGGPVTVWLRTEIGGQEGEDPRGRGEPARRSHGETERTEQAEQAGVCAPPALGVSRSSSPWVRLTVSDDGPGISPEKLPHIFDPFYSTRQGRGGTGLGLSIAHGIITDHGGTIDVTSECGKGTTFILHFPVPDPDRLEHPGPAATSIPA